MIASIRACPFGRTLQQTKFHPSCISPVPSSITGSLLRSPGRSFSSSTFLSSSYTDSAELKILGDLRQNKYTKWGWAIYRCTYNDDEAWTRFKDIVNYQSRHFIAKSAAPEVGDYLEWTFIEDRDTLENASKDQLRAHFKAWAAQAAEAEVPQLKNKPYSTYSIPRYNYFVHVDDDALRSVVYEAPQPPELDLNCFGYVNLVKADWVSIKEKLTADEMADEDLYFEYLYEPIDGCCEEDVGWMRVPSINLSPGFYDAMHDLGDAWYHFYKRPPEIVYY